LERKEFSGTKEMTASGQREQNVSIPGQEVPKMSDVVVTSLSNLKNEVRYGVDHTLVTDEPIEAGGEDAGPDPYTLLLAALGSCISMTVTLYAKRKKWPLERVIVRLRERRIHAVDCRECTREPEGYVHRIERSVSFEGDLSEEQRSRLQEIAHKCPLHKTLSSEILISELNDGAR
jgi:putative redox protein